MKWCVPVVHVSPLFSSRRRSDECALTFASANVSAFTRSTDGVEFLGFSFVGYGGNFRVSPKNQQKFKDRVREITRRNRGVSMSEKVFSVQFSVFRKHKTLMRFTEN